MMTDHIPNHRIDRSREVEDAIKLRAVQEKLRVARPIDAGRDILRGVLPAVVLTAVLTLTATPAKAQDFGTWWQQSFGYPKPASVAPISDSLELNARGIGCQTKARAPEWAQAEAMGRRVMQVYRDRGALPGQSPGTWAQEMEAWGQNATVWYLSCQVANRGVNAETQRMIVYGSFSFPNDTARIIAALPSTATAAGPSYADGFKAGVSAAAARAASTPAP